MLLDCIVVEFLGYFSTIVDKTQLKSGGYNNSASLLGYLPVVEGCWAR